MKIIVFLLMALPMVIFSSCKKQGFNPTANNGPAIQTAGSLEFILETTDMNGNFKSRFSQGENFELTLMIKNNSANGITLCHCFIPDSDPGLFAVYTAEPIISKFGTIAAGYSVGKPWNGAGGLDIAPITGIGSDSFIKYSLPWYISDTTVKYFAPTSYSIEAFHVVQNPMLPNGHFYTQFNFTYLNNPIHLKFYFDVNQ